MRGGVVPNGAPVRSFGGQPQAVAPNTLRSAASNGAGQRSFGGQYQPGVSFPGQRIGGPAPRNFGAVGPARFGNGSAIGRAAPMYRGHAFQPIHGRSYRFPAGYGYRRWGVGERLPLLFLIPDYYVNYQLYGLDVPPYGYQWVRYGPDVMLVRLDTGDISQTIYGAYDNDVPMDPAAQGGQPLSGYGGAPDGQQQARDIPPPLTPQPNVGQGLNMQGDASASPRQQVVARGTAVPSGSNSKALLDAENAARQDAARFAWNELRARSEFSSEAMRFSTDQNAAMAVALIDVCNFEKGNHWSDKDTKAITFQFSVSCPTQDITSRLTDLKVKNEAIRSQSLETLAHDKIVYLFLSRRIVGMTNGYSDNLSYHASQKTFELNSAQPLEDGLVQQINGVGLAAVSYADLTASGCASMDISNIKREFSTTGPDQSDYGLMTETRAEIIAAMRKCGVKFLALGSADVGVTGHDPKTGYSLGRVVASAQVLDIRQMLPVTVARVRSIADATGPDEVTAEEVAMAKAANDVGVKIVEQIKVSGIQ